MRPTFTADWWLYPLVLCVIGLVAKLAWHFYIRRYLLRSAPTHNFSADELHKLRKALIHSQNDEHPHHRGSLLQPLRKLARTLHGSFGFRNRTDSPAAAAVLYRLLRVISGPLDVDTVLGRLVEAAHDFTGCPCWISLPSPAGGGLTAVKGVGGSSGGYPLRAGGHWRILAAPLVHGGQSIAVLEVAQPLAGEGLGPEHEEVIALMAGAGALALAHALAHEKVLQQLQEIEARKRFKTMLLDRLPSGLIMCDPKGVITVTNEAARVLLAGAGEQWLPVPGRPLPAGGPLSPLWRSMAAALVDGREADPYRLQLTLHDRRCTLGVHVFPLHAVDSSLIAVVARLNDITAEEALIEQAQRAESLHSLGEVAVGAAHEIRNPLAAIRGMVEWLREEPAAVSAGAELIIAETERLGQLVGGLLGLVQPVGREAGFCSVNELLRQVAQLLSVSRRFDQIRIECRLDPALPGLHINANQIRQVLFNLGSNALDALPDEGVITFRTQHDHDTDMVLVSVEDSGVGIAPADRQRIFDPYFTSKQSGTGLGLPVSRKIVEAHNGYLSVHSVPGQGTAVVVHLPIHASGAAPAVAPDPDG